MIFLSLNRNLHFQAIKCSRMLVNLISCGSDVEQSLIKADTHQLTSWNLRLWFANHWVGSIFTIDFYLIELFREETSISPNSIPVTESLSNSGNSKAIKYVTVTAEKLAEYEYKLGTSFDAFKVPLFLKVIPALSQNCRFLYRIWYSILLNTWIGARKFLRIIFKVD